MNVNLANSSDAAFSDALSAMSLALMAQIADAKAMDAHTGRRPVTMADLKDIEPLAKELNAASDVLNAALEAIETKLNVLGVGLEVFLDEPLDKSVYEQIEDGPDRQYWVDRLGYGRYSDGWALLVRTARLVTSTDDFGKPAISEYDRADLPLLKASRSLRVKAVPQLPRLIEAIGSAASEMLASVDQARQLAESMK